MLQSRNKKRKMRRMEKTMSLEKNSSLEKNKATREVLIKARAALMNEIYRAGEQGGISRAQNYAPILVNLQGAIKVMDELIADESEEPASTRVKERDVSDRMAALREAKAAKKAEATSVTE